MNNNKVIFVSLVIVLLPLYASATARSGGWSPISNVKDPHVIEIGQFAVSEYDSQSHSRLKFVTVVSGETQVVSGTNYRLVLAVDGSLIKNYEAFVLEKPWLKSMHLTSFKPL